LVELIHRFDAVTTLTKGARTIDPASITQLLTLGVRQGDTITFTATGAESTQLLAAVQQLAAANFGDAPNAPLPVAEAVAHATVPATPAKVSAPTEPLAALPASPGIAVGPAHLLAKRTPMPQEQRISDVLAEQARLAAALQRTEDELSDLESRLQRRVGSDEAGILTAQRLVLTDNALRMRVLDQIATQQVSAAWAWQCAINAVVADYEALDDAYLRRRAADVRDVGNRLLLHLEQQSAPVKGQSPLKIPAILVATELSPSETAMLDPALVLGIVTESGGVTGHAAIIARSLGIPAVTGVAGVTALVEAGEQIALDGTKGELWLTLDDATYATVDERRQRWLAERAAAQILAQEPAVTQDGVRIEIAANIGGAAEVAPALAAGAEGVGLFRTEFLFMGRVDAPDEETQFQAYRAAAEALDKRPLLIRTLDVGGDKPLPYLAIPPEENPFLGWRGIRYCLDNPAFFRTQLRAILRASAGHRVQVMFPMVSTVAEVQRARALLMAEQRDLTAAGIACADQLAIGIMIETPAAVLNARQLAGAVDFFSIGTNDLTQYLMAADRGNSRVADLIDPLQPPVIAAIARVAEAAHVAGIWIGVCGELAAEPLVTPLLVGLGIDELSMSAPAIGAVKAVIRRIEHAAAVDLAHYIQTLPDAKAVRVALQRFAERAP
ncbi:MAG: phosphoenolpyruvate--protein phosphotransferase, partial [Caldilineaceae bacterium]|nr:phosphoenolpyruvate--protein phosphotransferase [Caldilineaceae bacterium]